MNTMSHTRTLMAAISALSLSGLGGLHAQVGTNTGLLNPNLASTDEIAALPHVDTEIARAIVDGRPYLTMTALHLLLSTHLGEAQLDQLYTRLFVPINLNTASRDEMLLVPGVGARLAHEFEEYRPYRALAQFRREIGKYVDDDEVAQLEQFVFVPIDLNTASAEAILSIPGVGQRMLREFEEYRPYRSMAQFRREIGKYVDDAELARLERYVVIGN